jgi:arabinofuranosyltransferase
MWRQGGFYLLDCINGDSLAVLTIVAAVAAAGAGFIPDAVPAASGIVTFVVVLVAIGGDAVSGRALVAPFVSAVMLLVRYPWFSVNRLVLVPLAAVLVTALASPSTPIRTDADFGAHVLSFDRWRDEPAPPPTIVNNIRDERQLQYPTTALIRAQRYVPLPDTSRAEVEVNVAAAEHRQVVVAEDVGLLSLVAERLYVIDLMGRTDAFLAHAVRASIWLPGGAVRALPAGYLETMQTGENRLDDPRLAEYFNAVSRVTRDPLFSWKRLSAIIRLNVSLLFRGAEGHASIG